MTINFTCFLLFFPPCLDAMRVAMKTDESAVVFGGFILLLCTPMLLLCKCLYSFEIYLMVMLIISSNISLISLCTRVMSCHVQRMLLSVESSGARWG